MFMTGGAFASHRALGFAQSSHMLQSKQIVSNATAFFYTDLKPALIAHLITYSHVHDRWCSSEPPCPRVCPVVARARRTHIKGTRV